MNDSYYDYCDASNPKKPQDDYWGDYDYADQVYIGDEWKKADYTGSFNNGPKCECGIEKTYGPDCPREYHSDYCPLYIKKI